MLHIGFKNYIAKSKILAITEVETAPFRRKRLDADELGKLINCSSGRKTRSLLHLSEGFVVMSSVNPQALRERWLGNE